MRKFRRYISLLCSLIILPFAAEAELTSNVGYRYTPVYGSNSKELDKMLEALEYEGLTTWQIEWTYSTVRNRTRCRLENPKVTLHTIITMPKWVNSQSGTPELRQRWQNYYDKLLKHEMAHKQNGERAAKDIHDAFQHMGYRSDCQALKEAVSRRMDKIVETHKRWDEDFDRRTDHGRNQGIVRP